MIWDMIERMASDRLWIYTAIVGSIFGWAFGTYFATTRLGLWFTQSFINCRLSCKSLGDYVVPTTRRHGVYHITNKIDELENAFLTKTVDNLSYLCYIVSNQLGEIYGTIFRIRRKQTKELGP